MRTVGLRLRHSVTVVFSQVYCPLPATNRAPDWKGQVCSYPSPSARSAVHRYLPRRARPPSSIVVPCHPRDARASRSARFALRASRCQTRGEKTAMRLSLPTRRTTGWQVRAHANGWRAASPRIGAPCAAANLLSPCPAVLKACGHVFHSHCLINHIRHWCRYGSHTALCCPLCRRYAHTEGAGSGRRAIMWLPKARQTKRSREEEVAAARQTLVMFEQMFEMAGGRAA